MLVKYTVYFTPKPGFTQAAHASETGTILPQVFSGLMNVPDPLQTTHDYLTLELLTIGRKVARQLFAESNTAEDPWYRGHRSMSVGDIVEVELCGSSVALECTNSDWKQVMELCH